MFRATWLTWKDMIIEVASLGCSREGRFHWGVVETYLLCSSLVQSAQLHCDWLGLLRGCVCLSKPAHKKCQDALWIYEIKDHIFRRNEGHKWALWLEVSFEIDSGTRYRYSKYIGWYGKPYDPSLTLGHREHRLHRPSNTQVRLSGSWSLLSLPRIPKPRSPLWHSPEYLQYRL